MSGSRFSRLWPGRAQVLGLTWMPPSVVAEWLGAGSLAPAEALAGLAARVKPDFCFVPADEPWATEAAALVSREGVAVGWAVPGPLGIVAERLGWTTLIRQTAAAPESLVGPLAEALHESAELARRGVREGASFLVVADDLASSAGWLVSPDFALSAIAPCFAHIVGEAGDHPACFHSDGDVRALFTALAASGFDAVHAASGVSAVAIAAAAVERGMDTFGGLVPDGGDAGSASCGDSPSRGGSIRFVCDGGGISSPAELDRAAGCIRRLREGSA